MNRPIRTFIALCFAAGLPGCPGDPGLDYVNCGMNVPAQQYYQGAALPQGVTLKVGDVISHCIDDACLRDELKLPAHADNPNGWPLLARQGCSIDLTLKPSTTRCDDGVVHANSTTIEVIVQAPLFTSSAGSYRTTVHLERPNAAPRPLFHSTVNVLVNRGVEGKSCDRYVETSDIVVDP